MVLLLLLLLLLLLCRGRRFLSTNSPRTLLIKAAQDEEIRFMVRKGIFGASS